MLFSFFWCACTSAEHGFVFVCLYVCLCGVTKCFLRKYYKIMYVQICVCTILRIFFKKINFEKNLTLEIFLTSILIILILIFHILIFDFEYFQLHYLLYSQTGHMDDVWPSVCFSWFQISWCRVDPWQNFLDISKIE